VAGIDIALWDLAARRAGLPLWRHLGGTRGRVPVYASGLNPEGPEKLALARRAEGHRAFKLKVGFSAERDLGNLDTLRAALGDATTLMVDANQAWEPPVALAMAKLMERYRLAWLEEPLRADRSWGEWSVLAASSRTPLAAGENIAGLQGFDAAIASGILAVIQPDLAKWGGFTGCLTVARRVIAGGIRFCPHYLGAGIGLVASAHLLAAAGGDGMLEIDSNDNALRTMLAGPVNHVVDGQIELGNAPGLGIDPDLDALEQYRVGMFAS
jgi:L-alanine-DL-glutamate epimerase-like enolase superfamily enzyme